MSFLSTTFRFLSGLDMHARFLRATTGGKEGMKKNQERVEHLGHQIMGACEVLAERLLNRLGKSVSKRTFNGWRLDAWVLLALALSPSAALLGRSVWRVYSRLRHLSITVPAAAGGQLQGAPAPASKPNREMDAR